jgi:hypothetical protein
VRSPGYETRRQEIVPNADQRIFLSLGPEKPGAVAAPVRPRPRAPAPAPAPARTGGFHKFN